MKVHGTLQKNGKEFFLTAKETEDQEAGKYAIHSIVDAPKILKLEIGAELYGDVRRYSALELQQLGWSHHGSVEPGHLWVKEK